MMGDEDEDEQDVELPTMDVQKVCEPKVQAFLLR